VKAEVVDLLVAMGLQMRRRGDHGRARAYLRAANELARRPGDDLAALVEEGRLREVPGIGRSIEATIARFVRDGTKPEWLEQPPPEEGEALAWAAEQAAGPSPAWEALPFREAPDLHCHTTWSDGALTVDELVALAKRFGFRVLGISDHSGSLRIARGLRPHEQRAQWADIDRVQAAHPDMLLLKGTECDILADGSLDHPPDILEGFDYVIGSLHSDLRAPLEKQTTRLLRALEQPHLTIVGHPTTRVPGRRPRANLDLGAVFAAAVEHGVALEVNGNRGRLDLDEELARQALEAGARLSLGSDTHDASELAQFAEARRIAAAAGAREGDVVNFDVARRGRERREGRILV
jgi:DNA polymerase (family X)